MRGPLPSFLGLRACLCHNHSLPRNENVGIPASLLAPSRKALLHYLAWRWPATHSCPENSCRFPVPLKVLSGVGGSYNKIIDSNQGSLLWRNISYQYLLLCWSPETLALSGTSPIGMWPQVKWIWKIYEIYIFLAWYLCCDRIYFFASLTVTFRQMLWFFSWHRNSNNNEM